MFLNKIEYKAKRNNNQVYTSIVNAHGKFPRYSEVNYTTIAKEGYQENHVFYRCMQEIIKAAIQGEWRIYQKQKDGKEEYIDNHPILEILNRPNPINSKEELIKRIIAYYYIGGEAPLHKIVLSGNRIGGIYTYRPDKVKFEATGDIDYPYDNIEYVSGTSTKIESKHFTLFKNFNPLDDLDGLGHGMSAMQPSLKNGDLLNAFIDWNVSLLQNGASPSGAWVVQEPLDEDVYERAEKTIQNKHAGTLNVGKVMLLDGGANWIKMGENPKDMDWKEGKDSTIVDICCAFGVDPILVGYNKFSSYNNKREAKKDLYTSTVIPLMNELAGCFTSFLLPKEEKKHIYRNRL